MRADTLLHLWNRSAEFDPLTPALLQEKIWGDADFEPAGVFCEEEQGFCMACYRAENQRGYIKLLAVAPEARRRGLASHLLEQAEAYLRHKGAPCVRVCESNPNYLVPGLDIRYTPALVLLEKRGYCRVGETYNMHCPLLGVDFSPQGESCRRADPVDAPAIMDFLAEHFPLWRHEVQVMLQNRPPSLHLAFSDEGRIVGFAGYDGNNLGSGWFGPTGTAPEQRGRGLGRALLRRCLADLQAQGRSHCTIPWVGPYGFYARHAGARLDRVFWRYEKSL